MADLPIGIAIRRVRATQHQVAERMGAPRGYISRVENAHRIPMMEQFVRIANAMDVEPWRLLRFAQKLRAQMEASA